MRVQHTGGPVGSGHPGPLYQPPAPDDPSVVAGHRIAARLGVGALGPVYLAYAPTGQPVALTAVRPELAARSGFAAAFEHDVQAVRRVHGPYTVPVLGSGHDGSRYWLAAGYVPALTLHAAVTDTGRPLPVPVVLRLVAGVAEALRAVHHAGVVHSGLGPGTVLLAADGPRVTGYGVTRAAADAPGIPAFSSPEQAAEKAPVPATDVFALGQIAAYAAIGTPPFASRALHEEPDLSELPGELREIVTRCLIKDPALRPSPSQIIAMCTQATHHRPPTPWLPTPLQTLLTLPPPLPPPVPPAVSGATPPPAAGGSGVPAAGATAPVPPAVGGVGSGGALVPPAVGGVGVPAPGPTPPGGVALPPPSAVGGVVMPSGRPSGATPPGGVVMPSGRPSGATPPGGVVMPSGPPPGATPPRGVAVPPQAPPPVVPGRRRRGGVGGWVAVGLVVVGGVAVAGGVDRHRTDARPSAGAATVSSPAADVREYRQVQLAAGEGLVLETDPPQTLPGVENGTFGYAPDGDTFVSDPARGTLALLDPDAPGTLARCQADGNRVPSVGRARLTAGSRLCVMSADGTTTLVTFSQLPAAGGPLARVTVALTVWPAQQL
jgi:hypothetical protein